MFKKLQKQKALILISSSIVVFLIYMGISWYIAGQFVAPHPSRINISPTLISSDYEDITIQGADSTPLKGWLFHAPNDKLVILIHGIKQDRINNDYYAVFIAKELLAQGYNVLMYDSRAHGVSGGDQVTYGNKESQDIINVVNFAKEKGFSPNHVGIIANSLGAISLLTAAAQLPTVGALIVDSPAAHLKPVLAGVMQRENHIPSLFNPGTFFLLKVMYQVDIDEIQPLKHVAAVPNRKFLFLHGALDLTIPPTNSQELIKKANPSSMLVIFPNGSHVETYKSDPQKYRDILFSFLNDELGK